MNIKDDLKWFFKQNSWELNKLKDADVLIDYRSTDNVEIDNSDDWYYHNKSEIVVHITT